MDLNKTGKYLKKLREENNLTQKDVAYQLNISVQAVSKWETGKSFPDVGLLERISKLYNVKVEYLLNGKLTETIGYYNKKTKMKSILIITLVIVFSIFTLFFLTTFNKFKIYELNSGDVAKGYFVSTTDYNVFDLKLSNTENIERVMLYYKVEEQGYLIIKGGLSVLNITGEYKYGNEIDMIKNHLNDLYVRIYYNDSYEDIKINTELIHVNNSLINIKHQPEYSNYIDHDIIINNIDDMKKVKEMYDGFIIGHQKDIYNPWSITNYLEEGKLYPYWASTSSNGLVNRLIRMSSADVKEKMEDLLQGKTIVVNFDEQIVYNQLDQNENAIWSLLLASGYLKVEEVDYRGITREPWYTLKITNIETLSMFMTMFRGWFQNSDANYNDFVKALLKGSLKEMNIYMNDVALATFSSFDAGKKPSEKNQPERFYHGFVLGLLAELRDQYEIRSNRESGYGRYDVMLTPLNKNHNAIIIEFKVHEPEEETSLQDTVQSALDQISEKNYDAELLARGIPVDRIRHYGFAFEGKKVLIG